MIIGLLPPLILIGVIVWLVSRARRGGPAPERGVHTLRRFLQYGFLLAAVLTAGNGASRLLGAALPAGAFAERRATDLAMGVALTAVAAPIWVWLWLAVKRRLADDETERSSTGWGLYLAATVTVGLLVSYAQLIEVARWLLGVEAYAPEPVAYSVVWLALWGLHTWLLTAHRLRPAGTPVMLATVTGSLVGLVGLTVSFGVVLATALRELYAATVGPALVGVSLRETLGVSAVVLVLGAAVWWWHWWRQTRTAERSTLWHSYVLLAGVLGGLATMLIAAGTALHAVLQWWFGVPEATRAAAHFELLPSTLAAAVVGGVVWWYHREVLGTDPGRVRSEPDRVYDHLVSAVGLLAGAAGVTVIVMAALQRAAGEVLAAVDPTGRNALAVAVTLLIVGTPLWAKVWSGLQRRVTAGDEAERRSPTRRSYLVLLLGIGSLVAAVSLSVVLFVVVRDLLEGELARSVLMDLRVAFGLIVAAGSIAGYHAAVYRRDRSVVGEGGQVKHPREVLLIGPDGQDLVRAISHDTGARVRSLHRLDLEPRHVDPARITAAILASPHDHLIVTIGAGETLEVIPYEDHR